MILSELNHADLSCIMFEDNTGVMFLARNRQVSKQIKYIDLKHHVFHEFTEDRNGIQKGAIWKTCRDFNVVGIRTKNLGVKAFKRCTTELDQCMHVLRERVYGKNRILKQRDFLVKCHSQCLCSWSVWLWCTKMNVNVTSQNDTCFEVSHSFRICNGTHFEVCLNSIMMSYSS